MKELHKPLPPFVSWFALCASLVAALSILFFNYRITYIEHADSVGPKYASINDLGQQNQVILLEPENQVGANIGTATSTEPATSTEDLPTELEGYKPSPETTWAKLYLEQLQIDPVTFKLDIEYIRQWQQTGGLTRDLTQGFKGTDVRLTQYLLHKLAPSYGSSFSIKNITGTYGAQTKSEVSKLQKKLGLNANGMLSGEIRFFFDSLYFKQLCPDADPDQDNSYENVNRRISVPKDYIPSDLIRLPRSVRTAGVMCLSREPARRLDEMFKAAATDQIDLAVFSAYRSSETQALLTEYYLRTLGQAGLAGIAEAGHSEHQLGTTVDLSGKSINYAGPSNAFGTAKEGLWLAQNSYKFGFILSYPKGRQQDTGYIYEPWHFRYLGIDTARDVFEEKMTIQEYLNLVTGSSTLPVEDDHQ